MVALAWLLDIIGFIGFIWADSIKHAAFALGIVSLGLICAQIAVSAVEKQKVDANGDGKVDMTEAFSGFQSLSQARSALRSCIISMVIITVWIGWRYFA